MGHLCLHGPQTRDPPQQEARQGSPGFLDVSALSLWVASQVLCPGNVTPDPQRAPRTSVWGPAGHSPLSLAWAITSAASLLITLVTYRGQLACLAIVTARYTASASTWGTRRRSARARAPRPPSDPYPGILGPGGTLCVAEDPACGSVPRIWVDLCSIRACPHRLLGLWEGP